MNLRTITTEAELGDVATISRAIVCLTVPWSVFSLRAQSDLESAIVRLRELGVSLDGFVLDEALDVCRQWLAKLGLPPPFDGGVPQGWGTLIWLEFGRMVSWSGHGNEDRPVGIISRTKLLWQKTSPEVF